MSVGRSVSISSSLYPSLRFSCPYAFMMTFPSFSLTRRFGMPYFQDSFLVICYSFRRLSCPFIKAFKVAMFV